jgi:hypothetical protein
MELLHLYEYMRTRILHCVQFVFSRRVIRPFNRTQGLSSSKLNANSLWIHGVRFKVPQSSVKPGSPRARVALLKRNLGDAFLKRQLKEAVS